MLIIKDAGEAYTEPEPMVEYKPGEIYTAPKPMLIIKTREAYTEPEPIVEYRTWRNIHGTWTYVDY